MISLLAKSRLRKSNVIELALLLSAIFAPLTQGQGPAAQPALEWIRPQGIDGAIVIGGSGAVPEAALQRFLQAVGGDKAKVIVLVGDDQKDAEEKVYKKWTDRTAASVVALPPRDFENPKTIREVLSRATGIWIEDAKARPIVHGLVAATVEDELQRLLARGGAVGGNGDAASLLAAVTSLASGQVGKGLDVLPGAVIEPHFREGNRRVRLQATLTKVAGRVGYGIDDNTALIVRGRLLEVVGDGEVTVLLAAGKDRPAHTIAMKTGAKQDLTALRRNAAARASEAFPPKVSRVPEVPAGTLVIVGGGGNPPGLTEKFIELAGGPEAPIVVLPTAGDPEIAKNAGTAMFTKAGAKNVHSLPSRLKKDVEDPKNLETLHNARGIWFGGGRQWHFVDAYEGTKAFGLLHDVLRRGGVIGGSSAGATIQGEYLARGGVFHNFDIIYEGYERGFAFLPGVAIDQHFTQRKRQADMTKLMKVYPQLLGIGLDESTALTVHGHVAEVSGKGTAHFYDYRQPPGAVDFTPVRDGGRYDLKERQVLP